MGDLSLGTGRRRRTSIAVASVIATTAVLGSLAGTADAHTAARGHGGGSGSGGSSTGTTTTGTSTGGTTTSGSTGTTGTTGTGATTTAGTTTTGTTTTGATTTTGTTTTGATTAPTTTTTTPTPTTHTGTTTTPTTTDDSGAATDADDDQQDGAGSGWNGGWGSWVWGPGSSHGGGGSTTSATTVSRVDLDDAAISPNGDGNADVATTTFTVRGSGTVDAAVVNAAGVRVRALGSFTRGHTSVDWNGAGDAGAALPDGNYAITLTVAGVAAPAVSLPVSLDLVAPTLGVTSPSLKALKAAALRFAKAQRALAEARRRASRHGSRGSGSGSSNHSGWNHGKRATLDWGDDSGSTSRYADADDQGSPWEQAAVRHNAAVPVTLQLTEPSDVSVTATVAGKSWHVETWRDAGTSKVQVLLPAWKAGTRLKLAVAIADDAGNVARSTSSVALPALPTLPTRTTASLQDSGSSSSGSTTTGSTAVPEAGDSTSASTLPAWLQPIMLRATYAAGVPQSWATSSGLSHVLYHESTYRTTAQNPTSTAYGMFQFLDTTWSTVGCTKTSDAYTQSVCGLRYVERRYGTPEKAWVFWQAHNWY